MLAQQQTALAQLHSEACQLAPAMLALSQLELTEMQRNPPSHHQGQVDASFATAVLSVLVSSAEALQCSLLHNMPPASDAVAALQWDM